jgi:ParB family chromosome partitioning protein
VARSVRELRADQLRPNPYQPRRVFDEKALDELAQSIREHGVLQPVLVRRAGLDRYDLIAGERRWRAAQLAGLRTVPAIVIECDEQRMLEVALIENLQREDINVVEAGQAYQQLMDTFRLTQDEVAKRVGKARSTVANILRVMTLPPPVLDALQRGDLTEAHARYLVPLEREQQVEACEVIVARKLTVRETERLVREIRAGKSPSSRRRPRPAPDGRSDANAAAVEEALQTVLGTRVTVQTGEGAAGVIMIEYYSLDQLDGIVERIIGPAGD